jgi:hypothetical protein
VACDAEWISSIKATESGLDFVVVENPAHESRTNTITLDYGGSKYIVTVNQEPAPKPEPVPTPAPAPVVEPEPTPAPAPEEKKPFYMAIKTNMLYDAIAVPNLGVEFHLGKRFSLMANYTHAWWKNDAKNFYWQDYLGDEEYVRFVIAKAREYYTGEEPLKLFVNDYNLESDWDQNKKLKSLIHWIEVWESDNTTKIDGIGTQMHISYYENPETLASKNAAIENMFKLMAATGKLVKIL